MPTGTHQIREKSSILKCLVLSGMLVSVKLLAQSINPPQWVASPSIRVDAKKDDLVSFDQVLVGPNGLIVIPQRSDRRLLVYDSSGRRLSVVGRGGAGPGEIERINAAGWVGDSLWVFDRGMRLSLFRLDGRFIRQLTIAEPFVPATLSSARVPLYLSTVEGVYALGRGMLARTIEAPRSPIDCPCFAVISNSSEVIRILSTRPTGQYQTAVGASGSAMAVPFAWKDIVTTSSDGALVGTAFARIEDRRLGSFRLVVVRVNGDTSINRTYKTELVRIPPAMINSEVTASERRLRELNVSAAEFRNLVPINYVPYQGLVIGRDRTVWVKLRGSAAGVPWLVLDERGAPIGRIVLAPNLQIAEADRRRIWAIEEDGDGFRHLVVLSIQQ